MASRIEQIKIWLSAEDKSAATLDFIKNNILSIGAAYAAWRAVPAIIGSIIEKGRESEAVWNDVTAALTRHGHAVDGNLERIQHFADQMQTLSGISDEVIGKSVQGFVDYGQTVDEAMKTTRVAMDLAAGTGMDMKAATDLLYKAAVGYTGTLSRYGIIIDENIPKSEKFAAAIEQINQRFGGAAAARADTFAVKIDLLNERFGGLQERLFKMFSPAFLGVVNAGITALQGFTNVLDFLTGVETDLTDPVQAATRELNLQTQQINRLTSELQSGTITLDQFREGLNNLGRSKGLEEMPSKFDLFVDRYKKLLDITRERGLTAERFDLEFYRLQKAMNVSGNELLLWADSLEYAAREQERQYAERMKQIAMEQAAEAENLAQRRIILDQLSEMTRVALAVDFESAEAFDEARIQGESETARRMLEAANEKNKQWQDDYKTHLDTLASLDEKQFQASLVGLDEYTAERMQIERTYEQQLAAIKADRMLSGEELMAAEIALARLQADEIARIQITAEMNISEKRAAALKKMSADGRVVAIALEHAFENSMSNMVSNVVADLKFLHTESNGIFKQMAADFGQYFVQSLLQQLADLAIGSIETGKGILGLLGSLFDTPANDQMAALQGQHFVQHFARGMNAELGRQRLGTSLSGGGGAAIAIGPSMPSSQVSNITIQNINLSGGISSITGLAREIERVVVENRSSIMVDHSNITGKPAVQLRAYYG